MNRTALAVTAALAVVGTLVDAIVGYSPFPGYAAAIGLGGCAAIIIISNWLGRVLISRPEAHYPDDIPQDAHEDLHG